MGETSSRLKRNDADKWIWQMLINMIWQTSTFLRLSDYYYCREFKPCKSILRQSNITKNSRREWAFSSILLLCYWLKTYHYFTHKIRHNKLWYCIFLCESMSKWWRAIWSEVNVKPQPEKNTLLQRMDWIIWRKLHRCSLWRPLGSYHLSLIKS